MMSNILKLAVISQLFLESLEDAQLSAGIKSKRKTLVKQLIKNLATDVSNYNRAYSIDAETLRIIEQSYLYSIDSIARLEMPSVVIQAQLWETYKLDPDSVQANTSRILKKFNK
jgi:hypothetical protein